jgi:CheY-like chemotaxis protein
MIVVVVEDLLFLSKIRQTAEMLGVPTEVVEPIKAEERTRAASACAVILDLNHRAGGAVELVKALKANPATRGTPVIGFLSHVQRDLATAARAAGCDQVLARSTMTQRLPELLRALERQQPTAATDD